MVIQNILIKYLLTNTVFMFALSGCYTAGILPST